MVLCVLFIDRPLELWLHGQFWSTTVFAVGAAILRPLDGLLLVAAALLVFAAAWARLPGLLRLLCRHAPAGHARRGTWLPQVNNGGLPIGYEDE